jgi:hypothetical protein
VGKSHLVNTTQPLIVGMADYLEHQWVINTDETINRVVDDFSFETHVGAKVGFSTQGRHGAKKNLLHAENRRTQGEKYCITLRTLRLGVKKTIYSVPLCAIKLLRRNCSYTPHHFLPLSSSPIRWLWQMLMKVPPVF